MKKTGLLGVISTLTLILLNTCISFAAGNAGSPPPDDNINGTQYIEGDWDIIETEIYTDEIIILNGNLSIKNGGALILNNVILKFDGKHTMTVEEGGLLDSTNSTITVNSSSDNFNFRIEGKVNIKDTEISYTSFGVEILSTNDVLIDSSTIKNNKYAGIYIKSSSPKIVDTTITNNDYGIYIDNSSPLLDGNLIKNNYYGIYSIRSVLTIINNRIESNERYGIYCSKESSITIENSTLGGKQQDISLAESHATLINSQFEFAPQDIINASDITVLWYLHISVKDNKQKPISGAYVLVKDRNKQEIFNGTSRTDGMVKWILCKYMRISRDITFYTPHHIYVQKDGFNEFTAEIYMDKTKTENVVLTSKYVPEDDDKKGEKIDWQSLLLIFIFIFIVISLIVYKYFSKKRR